MCVDQVYKYSICKHISDSRSELYNHRMNQHSGNDNNELDDIPQ